jgi:peptidoglycan/LPS O-acetylase OafA/YrhL
MVFAYHSLHTTRLAHLPFIAHGYIGVWIFFALSGFLIGGILLRLRESAAPIWDKLRTFYARRALRILPVFWVFLVVTWFVFREVRAELPWNATYATNVALLLGKHLRLVHLWSLCVEEHFYLLAPLAILLLRPSHLIALGLALVAIGVVSRAVIFGWGLNSYSSFFSPFCFDALAVGVGAAAWDLRGLPAERLRRLGIGAFLVHAASLAIRHHWPKSHVARAGISLEYLACAVWTSVLVLHLWQRRAPVFARVLGWRPAVYVGRISYAVYLFHSPALWLLYPLTRHRHGTYLWAGTSLAVTVAAASVSWWVIERPIGGLKRWFAYADVGPFPLGDTLNRRPT